MNFGEQIKKLRIDKQWGQDFVAKKLNISVPALSRYENGIREPKSIEVVKDFAKLFDVSVDYLFDMDYEKKTKLIPLLGTVKAGYNRIADENLLGYVEIDYINVDEYFALKVTGDSMEPILYEGDIVIVHQQPTIDNGQVAVVLVDDEATIKKVNTYNSFIELTAFNSYYPPKRLNKGFKIIGKVVEARIKRVFDV